MAKHLIFYLGWGLGLLLLGACGKKGPNLPNMNLTLSANEAAPGGAKAFRGMVYNFFEYAEVASNNKPFEQWFREQNGFSKKNEVYFLLTPFLNTHPDEAEAMLNYVEHGNTLIIATDQCNEAFTQVFGIAINNYISTNKVSHPFGYIDTYKKLTASPNITADSFGIFYEPLTRFISLDSIKPDTGRHRIISYNEADKPDAMQFEIGNGHLIVVTNAVGLSNYFLMTSNNFRYAFGLLSYLSPYADGAVWDTFYLRNQNRPPQGSSVFDVIFSIPQLKRAFWLLVLLSAFWVLNNLIRRQRIIPVAKVFKNTSVEFTQTIARLYFNRKDNRDIALKMIQYFLEHLRNKHYMPAHQMDNDFAKLLSGKTNLPLFDAEALTGTMKAIQQGASVNDEDLLDLNRSIQRAVAGKG